MTRRQWLGQAAALGLGCAAENTRLIFVSMTGGPSHKDVFDFQPGAWTPDWMDPVGGFPRGLMPRLAERLGELRMVRGLRAASTDHGVALGAQPRCEVAVRANRTNFVEACGEAGRLIARHRSVRIDFGSWDHHGNLYANLRPMCAAFDGGLTELMRDLKRGRQRVRIVAMGEFGRAPGPLNQNGGRDHSHDHAALLWNAAKESGDAHYSIIL